MLLRNLPTRADNSWRDLDHLRVDVHCFKHLLYRFQNFVTDLSADIGRRIAGAEIRIDVNLNVFGEIDEKNLHEEFCVAERGNVVGKTLWRTILLLPDNFKVVLGEEAGDGTAKTAKRNTATAELDDQWDYMGRFGDVAFELTFGHGRHH